MPLDPVAGVPVRSIGLNVPEVATRLRDAFAPTRPAGAAFLRRPVELDSVLGDQSPVAVIGFLRQTIQQELGRATERELALYLYAAGIDGDARLLSDTERASVVRACVSAVRLRDSTENYPAARLVNLEGTLAQALRRPTSEEVEAGMRQIVWPVSAAVLV